MNVLIDINHPAHVHLYCNVYKMMSARGHKIIVTVKDIPAAIRLLQIYNIPYVLLGKKRDAILAKGLDQLYYEWQIMRLVRKHKIEIGVGSSINLAHVSRLTKMKSIILDDDDDAVEPLFAKYAHPFADVILTPDAIRRKAKQTVYYAGTHELAYLHPYRFTPDKNILNEVGIKKNELFFILRFNAFKAHHDAGAQGLTLDDKRRLLHMLEQKGRVLITTERDIDDEFKPYQLAVSPEKIHSLMYYATMLIGDSQTMTSEAAVLGTPAVKCNSFAGRLAVPNELEKKNRLCYSFLPEQREAFFTKIEELLAMPDLKEEWQRRREKMLAEKIDVTAFYTWFIENYPESAKIMRENPDYQWRFK